MATVRIDSGVVNGSVYVDEATGETEVTLRFNGMPTTFDVAAWRALVERVEATVEFAQEQTDYTPSTEGTAVDLGPMR